MSYHFNPYTEEELNQTDLIEDGVYDFEVKKSKPKMSKSNNPMSELTIQVWDKEGKTHTIIDYLVFSDIKLNIRKVKHFCEAVGISELYKTGELPEEFGGYSGKCVITKQEGQEIPFEKLNGKQPGSKYPDRNVIGDYVMTDKFSVKVESGEKKDDFINDDVPF